MSGFYYRNYEGYKDPTAGAALASMISEEKRKQRAVKRMQDKDKKCVEDREEKQDERP